MSDEKRLRDLPPLDPSGRNIRDVVAAIREALQTARGYRGDPLDRSLTLRDLDSVTQRSVLGGGSLGSGGSTTIVSGGGGTGGGGDTPDPTPPPTPSGLAVTAGLSSIFVSCDTPVYTQGHGHGVTVVYGSKWAASDPTPPTFSEAVELFRFQGTFAAYPSDLGVRWCIWIKWESLDGYLSASPAGGTNGEQATTGKIGSNDLGPLVVNADHLSAGTYAGINLVPNPGAEDGTAGWSLIEGTAQTFTADATEKAEGSRSFKLTKASTSAQSAYGCRAMPVIPGETYSVKVRIKTSAAIAGGLYIYMLGASAAPAGGYVTRALATNVAFLLNGTQAATGDWTAYEYTYTAPAGIYFATLGIALWNDAGATALSANWDSVAFGRQITASHLAAGSIAVGSAAIANLAVRTALIDNLAVTNAKVSDMAVDKLTGSKMRVGAYIESTNYTSGPSGNGFRINADGTAELQAAYIRGKVTASQIDGRSLDIKNSAGEITFSANGLGVSRGGYVNSDPMLMAPGEWTFNISTPNYYQGFSPGTDGLQNAWDSLSGAYAEIYSSRFPISPSKTYRIDSSLYQWAAGSNIYFLGVWFYDVNGNTIVGSTSGSTGWTGLGSFHYYVTAATMPVGISNFTFTFGPLGTGSIPPGAVSARVLCIGNYTNLGSARWSWGGARVREMVDANTLRITGGNVSTFIASAAIKLAQIDVATIGSLSALTATIGVLRTATTGQRTEIRDNVIKVFDASNVLRVRLGDLTL